MPRGKQKKQEIDKLFFRNGTMFVHSHGELKELHEYNFDAVSQVGDMADRWAIDV